MRLYTFINMYLSSIQQGIQTAHIVHDLFVKYPTSEDDPSWVLWNWAEHHKTIIVLNGGTYADIRDLLMFFDQDENLFPWIEFREDGASLDGIITGAGIVLPPQIYETAAVFRTNKFLTPYEAIPPEYLPYQPSPWELELIMNLNNYSLAR